MRGSTTPGDHQEDARCTGSSGGTRRGHAHRPWLAAALEFAKAAARGREGQRCKEETGQRLTTGSVSASGVAGEARGPVNRRRDPSGVAGKMNSRAAMWCSSGGNSRGRKRTEPIDADLQDMMQRREIHGGHDDYGRQRAAAIWWLGDDKERGGKEEMAARRGQGRKGIPQLS